MRVDYAREKLYQAIDCLVGAGSIQERLIWAANCLISLTSDDFPEEERQTFEDLWSELTRYPNDHAGAITDSVNRLHEEEATKVARGIFSLYITIRGGI